MSSASTLTMPAGKSRTRTAVGRGGLIWGTFAVLLLVAPLFWTSGLGQTVLSQIGIAIIACLAYNILLGQGGMLSFGHAVYSGLGGFIAIHALNQLAAGKLWLPVSLIPLVGGFAGLFFAFLLGYVTTKKAGTTFAMITLGIGELVASMVLMLPEFFGGEGGISGNRSVGQPFMGITFGPQIQVYYLIAAYCFVSTALMYALTLTPLGRILNAVRDNPERVEFIGYSTQRVRYLAFMISGFFAGIAGGLGALNFEIVTGEVVGAARSAGYLLFVFLGGAGFFFGPIIGAVLMVIASALLSELTHAWLLYVGLAFMLMVMFAPGGLASLIMLNARLAAYGKLRRFAVPYLALICSAAVMLAGLAAIVEMIYHIQLGSSADAKMRFAGLILDTHALDTWLGATVIAVVGTALFEFARRRFKRLWSDTQDEIELLHSSRGGAA